MPSSISFFLFWSIRSGSGIFYIYNIQLMILRCVISIVERVRLANKLFLMKVPPLHKYFKSFVYLTTYLSNAQGRSVICFFSFLYFIIYNYNNILLVLNAQTFENIIFFVKFCRDYLGSNKSQ